MNQIYNFCSTSKQSHHKYLQRQQTWQLKEQTIVGLILQIREIHPAMGLRTMYEFYKPESIGRDAFISTGLKFGFRTKIFKNKAKTTFSSIIERYDFC